VRFRNEVTKMKYTAIRRCATLQSAFDATIKVAIGHVSRTSAATPGPALRAVAANGLHAEPAAETVPRRYHTPTTSTFPRINRADIATLHGFLLHVCPREHTWRIMAKLRVIMSSSASDQGKKLVESPCPCCLYLCDTPSRVDFSVLFWYLSRPPRPSRHTS
jgi:hypothetical protein